MTLVLTTDVGPAGTVLDVLTPAQSTTRQRAQTLDSTLVGNASGVAGATVTDALNALAGADANFARIAGTGRLDNWDSTGAGGPGTVTVLAAGHAAGLYLISLSIQVTAFSVVPGNSTAITLIYTGAGGVAQNSNTTGAIAGTSSVNRALAGVVGAAGNQRPQMPQVIFSDGSAPVTITVANGGTYTANLLASAVYLGSP